MKKLTVLLLTAIFLTSCATKTAQKPSTAPSKASNFVSVVTNPWYPLRPGTVLTYKGSEDGNQLRETLTVTSRKKVIQGVSTTVVSDLLYEEGRLHERTEDWYAQDKAGNVWYFGEDTAVLDAKGKVKDTEGSWQAGRDGARAGIFMPAHPKVGQSFRQEYFKGHAEDRFEIVSLTEKVKTPGASSSHAMLTKETTPLEPDVLDHKLYVKGIGTVIEETVKGGDEKLILQSVKR
jgi:hypothetical protein